LVEAFLKGNQVPRNEFIAGASEFMRMANIKYFPQAPVGIKADAVPIGNGDEHKVEKLLHAS